MNLVFTVIEIIGGIYTGSVAIMSDALHDLGDSLSLGLGWTLQKISRREKSENFTFGYKRFSLLGALVNSLILIVGSGVILYEAVPRLLDPQQPLAEGMIVLAVFGIIANGAAVYSLSRGKSINERVVRLHLLEDVLGWAAVLIGAVIMTFTDAPVIDPILSIAITAYILYNVITNLTKTLKIFLQAKPTEIDVGKIREFILEIDKVEKINDLHIWTLEGETSIFTINISVCNIKQFTEEKDIKEKIKEYLGGLNIHHATIEIDHLENGESNEECLL